MKGNVSCKLLHLLLCVSFFLFTGMEAHPSQRTDELDREAEAYLEQKDFSRAMSIWLSILDTDPENEKVQKKVEMVYLLKQEKDLSMQRAKFNYRISKKILIKNKKTGDMTSEEMNEVFTKSKVAIDSFIIAYRIDPKDTELITMRDDMRRLDEEVRAEREKDRLSQEKKEKSKKLEKIAKKMMDDELYESALINWKEILAMLPNHTNAREGKRSSELAIENRQKFEKIKKYMFIGKDLLKELNYRDARLAFSEVMNMDPGNRDAKDYIEQIDEKLEEKRNIETKKIQAEESYVSGISNINMNRFDQAREDFEHALSLVDNYKDAKERIASIERLKKEYDSRERTARIEKSTREFENGLIAFSEGRYKDAIASFEITLSIDPKNASALSYIAFAKNAQRQIEDEKVDKNSPYFEIIESQIIAGKKLYDAGDYQESKNNWSRVLSLFPKNDTAIEYNFRIDLRLNPGTLKTVSERYIREGEEFLKKKEYRSALKKFELIKAVSESHPGIDRLLAQARDGLKSSSLTLAQTNRADRVLTNADRAEANRRYEFGLELYNRGGKENFEKALTEFLWVVQNDPENIKAIISANKIQAQLSIGIGAGQDEKLKLTAEQQNLVRKFYYQGINYYSNNDLQRAIAEWRKVLAIDPDHVQAKNNIRKVLVFIGR